MEDIAELQTAIRACHLCEDLPKISYPLVRGHGCAKIVLVSQAPSKGATLAHCLWRNSYSGDTFRKEWLGISDDVFYDEDVFYITSMGKCYPGRASGGDRLPDSVCAETWLVQELDLLSPRLIITIGKKAFKWFFPGRNYDRNLQGETIRWNKREVLPLPHPSGANNAWKARNRDRLRVIIKRLRSRVYSVLEENGTSPHRNRVAK